MSNTNDRLNKYRNELINKTVYMYDLFNSSDNKLTFDKVGYINNNYPPPWEYEITDEQLIDSYICSDMCEVYTCGYTKHNIIN